MSKPTINIGDLHYFDGFPANVGQVISTVTRVEGEVERVMHMVQDPMGALREIESGAIKQLQAIIGSQGGIFSQFADMIPQIMRSL